MKIKALGFDPENLHKLFKFPELSVSKWGTIKINLMTMETNIKGVFAAGDIVRGARSIGESATGDDLDFILMEDGSYETYEETTEGAVMPLESRKIWNVPPPSYIRLITT